MASPGERALHIVVILGWLVTWALVLHVVAGIVRAHREQHGHNTQRTGLHVEGPKAGHLQARSRLHGRDCAGQRGVRA
ncbi:hypothetical protein [Lysobacter olei]